MLWVLLLLPMCLACTCPLSCPVGSQTNASGATSVLDCVAMPGSYGSHSLFHACPEGFYCTGLEALPIRCPDGYLCPQGTFNYTSMCQAGYYGAPPDCLSCPALQTSTQGSDHCDCMPGYYNASRPQTAAVGNATNYTESLAPFSDCSLASGCPRDYFCPDAGPPLSCPPNSTAPPGSLSISMCQCPSGYALNASSLCSPVQSSSLALIAGIAGGGAVVAAGVTWAAASLSHVAVVAHAASMMGSQLIGMDYIRVKIE